VGSEHIISTATSYWASHLGCSTEAIFAQPLHIITHGADLDDYDGIFALFRGCAATISFPPDCLESLRHQLPPQPLTPAIFADAFRGSGFTVIGRHSAVFQVEPVVASSPTPRWQGRSVAVGTSCPAAAPASPKLAGFTTHWSAAA
jgi:hypothetical protein